MVNYRHIFFDLDHTLWDFEKNSSETLAELFELHQLHRFGLFDLPAFESTYSEVNRNFWDLYNHGKISKEELREKRFRDSFLKLGLEEAFHPRDICMQYLEICPGKSHLFPNAIETLDYLSGKYNMSIITNGFPESQFRKMESSKITRYFGEVIISEQVGFSKPHKGIFDHALQLGGISHRDAVMIGDNLETDIGGALLSGLDAIWFNDQKKKADHQATHEISDLKELTRIL